MPENDDLKSILQLRLLIIRAAQKDSLGWWEDESLTRAGGFLVEKLFLMDTAETARKLAMEAARTRYRMAFGDDKNRLHLFRLDRTGQVEYDLRELRFTSVDMPMEPIPSMEALREKLLALTGQPVPYEKVGERGMNSELEIRIAGFSAKTPPLALAKTLAWACLESPPGRPLFPYVQWNP